MALIQMSLLEEAVKAETKLYTHNLGKNHCPRVPFKSTIWLLVGIQQLLSFQVTLKSI